MNRTKGLGKGREGKGREGESGEECVEEERRRMEGEQVVAGRDGVMARELESVGGGQGWAGAGKWWVQSGHVGLSLGPPSRWVSLDAPCACGVESGVGLRVRGAYELLEPEN